MGLLAVVVVVAVVNWGHQRAQDAALPVCRETDPETHPTTRDCGCQNEEVHSTPGTVRDATVLSHH
jgi:hypothetical protein